MPKEALVPQRAAIVEMTDISTPPRAFADQQTEITWKVRDAIRRIAPKLPPHGMPAHRIRFVPGDETAGAAALLFAGDIGPLAEEDADLFLVSDRSLDAFRKLGIQFNIEP